MRTARWEIRAAEFWWFARGLCVRRAASNFRAPVIYARPRSSLSSYVYCWFIYPIGLRALFWCRSNFWVARGRSNTRIWWASARGNFALGIIRLQRLLGGVNWMIYPPLYAPRQLAKVVFARTGAILWFIKSFVRRSRWSVFRRRRVEMEREKRSHSGLAWNHQGDQILSYSAFQHQNFLVF